jgi:hypothetical protein
VVKHLLLIGVVLLKSNSLQSLRIPKDNGINATTNHIFTLHGDSLIF